MVFSADKCLFSFREALKSTCLWDTRTSVLLRRGMYIASKTSIALSVLPAGEALGMSELSWHCLGHEKQTSRPV